MFFLGHPYHNITENTGWHSRSRTWGGAVGGCHWFRLFNSPWADERLAEQSGQSRRARWVENQNQSQPHPDPKPVVSPCKYEQFQESKCQRSPEDGGDERMRGPWRRGEQATEDNQGSSSTTDSLDQGRSDNEQRYTKCDQGEVSHNKLTLWGWGKSVKLPVRHIIWWFSRTAETVYKITGYKEKSIMKKTSQSPNIPYPCRVTFGRLLSKSAL